MKVTRRGLFGLVAGLAATAVVGKEAPRKPYVDWVKATVYSRPVDISQYRAVNKRVHYNEGLMLHVPGITALTYVRTHQTSYIVRGT